MDDHTGGSGAGCDQTMPSSASPGDPGGTLADQLARAQERLAFYESFDGLIQDNISRSGDLLRQAMEMREGAAREIAQARAELDQRLKAEREQHRATVASLVDELTRLQQQTIDLVGRVTDALRDMDDRFASPSVAAPAAGTAGADTTPSGSVPPAVAVAPAAPGANAEPVGSAARMEQGEAAVEPAAPAEHASVPAPEPLPFDRTGSVEELASPAVGIGMPPVSSSAVPQPGVAPGLDEASFPAPATMADAPSAPRAAEPTVEQTAAEASSADGARTAATSAPAESADTLAIDPSAPRQVMVLVHGVPRAAAALSLQRHLAGLGHVDTVEAREYAEGILRLQVVARGPLGLEDLRRWEGGSNLEPVHVLADVIEVKLPGATGL